MKTDKTEKHGNGTKIDDAKDVPTNQEKIVPTNQEKSPFEFELPPVSEQTTDFIEADPETNESNETAVIGFEENAEAEKHRGALDDKGQPFDPLIHTYPPEKTGKFGKWKKAPKRKVEQAAVDEVKSNAAYRGEAQKFATLYGESHRMLFGAGGHVNKDELIPLVDSLERYMLENGHTEISAGWDVLLSSGMYSYAVCVRETNIEKVKRIFGGVFNKLKLMFGFNVENPKNKGVKKDA